MGVVERSRRSGIDFSASKQLLDDTRQFGMFRAVN